MSRPSPYVVLDAPDWTLTRVDGDPGDGQVRYRRGEARLKVSWRPATTYDGYLASRRRKISCGTAPVLDRAAEVFAYGADDHTAVRPVEGETFVEVRGSEMSNQDYLDLLPRLRRVGTEGFEAVLPPDVARPAEVADAVAAALVGVETPPGFDRTAIGVPPYQQPYHLGAAVTGVVTCAWIDHHAAARAAGDADGVRRAVAALQGSRRWPVLLAMQAEGDWSSVLWDVADQLAAGSPSHQLHGQVCR